MNVNELAQIQTAGNFVDGTYDFRVRGYRALASGLPDPSDPGVVLDGCGGHAENNLIVLRIDNRIVGPGIPGNVHLETTEPDCGITSIKLGTVEVEPCDSKPLPPNTSLEIEFFCSDPDGHLGSYDLRVMWGDGNERSLFDFASPTAAAAGVQPGWTYAQAVSVAQGGTRPVWKGGPMKLFIKDARLVFPKTCCYLLQLTAWKRNYVGCNTPVYWNRVHQSFTVIVGP